MREREREREKERKRERDREKESKREKETEKERAREREKETEKEKEKERARKRAIRNLRCSGPKACNTLAIVVSCAEYILNFNGLYNHSYADVNSIHTNHKDSYTFRRKTFALHILKYFLQ